MDTAGPLARTVSRREEVAPAATVGIFGAAPLIGEAALRRLEEEIVRTGAALGSGLGDPARYPAAPARPTKAWVSQIGGPWSHVWKAGA